MPRTKKYISILFYIVLLGTIVVRVQSETGIPSIGEPVAILQVQDQYRGFDNPLIFEKANQFEEIEMSLSGRYIVGRTRIEQSGTLFFSNLYVWDTSDFNIAGQVIFPEPQTTLALNQTNYRADFAISPNDTYLALLTNNALQLLTLPDLEFSREIPTVSGVRMSVGLISWSTDGNTVAFLTERATDMVFWNIDIDETFTVSLDVQPFPNWLTVETNLVATAHGWIIRNFYQHPEIAFIYCSLEGECIQSIIDDSLITETFQDFATISSQTIIADRSTTILTNIRAIDDNRWEVGHRVIVWRYDGRYEVSSLLPEISIAYCPYRVSPMATYFYSVYCGTQDAIWNTNTMEIQRFMSFEPTWLSNDTFFATLNEDFVFLLGRVDEDGMIDSLTIASIPDIDRNELTFNEKSGIQGVGANGRRVLITLGGIAAVISVEYK
jgi:WD40 repeat protein